MKKRILKNFAGANSRAVKTSTVNPDLKYPVAWKNKGEGRLI